MILFCFFEVELFLAHLVTCCKVVVTGVFLQLFCLILLLNFTLDVVLDRTVSLHKKLRRFWVSGSLLSEGVGLGGCSRLSRTLITNRGVRGIFEICRGQKDKWPNADFWGVS